MPFRSQFLNIYAHVILPGSKRKHLTFTNNVNTIIMFLYTFSCVLKQNWFFLEFFSILSSRPLYKYRQWQLLCVQHLSDTWDITHFEVSGFMIDNAKYHCLVNFFLSNHQHSVNHYIVSFSDMCGLSLSVNFQLCKYVFVMEVVPTMDGSKFRLMGKNGARFVTIVLIMIVQR